LPINENLYRGLFIDKGSHSVKSIGSEAFNFG
jgi:hypothetical protein